MKLSRGAASTAIVALEGVSATTEPRQAARDTFSKIASNSQPGKPVGAVVAAANVLRTLHASERPLNASEVARAAGLHRGTAYNICGRCKQRDLSATTRRPAATRSAFIFSNSPMASCGAAD
ncbi:MAG: helix-turn-helix domain-containing protein [Stellaceae bacterium]